MEIKVREILARLVTEQGTALYQDARRCESFLRDCCPHNKKEIFLLVTALEEGVVKELQARNQQPPEIVIAALGQGLAELGMDRQAARWAVESWAMALGSFPQGFSGSPPGSLVHPEERAATGSALSSTPTVPQHNRSEACLLVSCPPQSAETDVPAIAATLGLTAVEARWKMNYTFPAVLGVEDDFGQASTKLQQLQNAGLQVVLLTAQQILAIPPLSKVKVRQFAFEEETSYWQLDGNQHLFISYPSRVAAVLCQPKLQIKKEEISWVDSKPDWTKTIHDLPQDADPRVYEIQVSPFVDLYFLENGKLSRCCLVSGFSSFSGLGERMASSSRQNQDILIAEMRQRFRTFQVDSSLVNKEYRPLPFPGKLLLGLKNLDTYDLASRLIFLTRFTA